MNSPTATPLLSPHSRGRVGRAARGKKASSGIRSSPMQSHHQQHDPLRLGNDPPPLADRLIFIGQFGLGFVMVRLTSQRTAFELIQLHKSFGFLLLGLIILRIAWRLGNAAPALPDSVGALERRTAPLAHLALYAFQLALPLSGWALVSVSMLEIPQHAVQPVCHAEPAASARPMRRKVFGHRRTGILPMPALRWSRCMSRRRCGIISGCATACSRA